MIKKSDTKAYEAKIVSIASPKGGVGRTVLSSLLAYQLSVSGEKVLLVDGSYGLGNIDNYFQMHTEHGLNDYFFRNISISKVITEISSNLSFISSGHGHLDLANIDSAELEGFFIDLEIYRREYNYIIIDTGSGIHSQQLLSLKYADITILNVTPENSVLADNLFYCRIINCLRDTSKFGLVINKAENQIQAEAIYQFYSRACDKLSIEAPHYTGHINQDKNLQLLKPVSLDEFYSGINPDNKALLKEWANYICDMQKNETLKFAARNTDSTSGVIA